MGYVMVLLRLQGFNPDHLTPDSVGVFLLLQSYFIVYFFILHFINYYCFICLVFDFQCLFLHVAS